MSRNNSLGGPVRRNAKSRGASNRTSTGSLLGDSTMANAMKHLRERSPVTVAEKHAELLHFIAQKESKCLELRSQLAMHEAELLQLKRKWELVVNRGFEKYQASPSPSSASFPNPPSALSPSLPFVSPSSTSASSARTASSPYFPLIPGPHAPVLEGIKGGVQGMSRLIAAGLESIAGGSIEPGHDSHQSRAFLHQPPLPLRLGSVSELDGKTSKRHAQNESQSSSSTVASISSESAANTSATSVRSSSSFDGSASPARRQIQQTAQEEDTLDAREEHKNSTPVSNRSEQVLIVRDTGATPTMSPNPDFERKRRSKKPIGTNGDAPAPENEKDFDAWLHDEVSFRSRREQQKTSWVNAQVSGSAAETSTTMVQSSKPPPPLPPMSTIPGLATMNLAGPAAQQVSSWVGSVGKKLGEIRGSSTFTKSQKRASLLLSDMQNTFVSSLISPPPTASPSSATAREQLPVLNPIFTCNGMASQPSNASLLDEFDNDLAGHAAPKLTTPVLVPSMRISSLSTMKPDQHRLETKEAESKGGSESDEDWNW